MTTHTRHVCDVCEQDKDYHTLQEGPIVIQVTNNGQSKIFYRRIAVSYGEHICKDCIKRFTKAIQATIEGEDIGPHIMDYDAVGPEAK